MTIEHSGPESKIPTETEEEEESGSSTSTVCEIKHLKQLTRLDRAIFYDVILPVLICNNL